MRRRVFFYVSHSYPIKVIKILNNFSQTQIIKFLTIY